MPLKSLKICGAPADQFPLPLAVTPPPRLTEKVQVPVPNVWFALTLVILPLTEIGTVPPWNGASTVPTMLRLMSTVPVPVPTGDVKLIAPLLTVMVKAVELTFDVVFVPLLLTGTRPEYVPEKLPLRMAKVADESRVRSSSISMAAHIGDTKKRERDRARRR